MDNGWTASKIEFRKSDSQKELVLQKDKEEWCLKSLEDRYLKGSLYDAATLATAILECKYKKIAIDTLAIELYSYIDEKYIRTACSKIDSKQEILEKLSKAVRINISNDSVLPDGIQSGKTVYELVDAVTKYLIYVDVVVSKISISVIIGDNCSTKVTFKREKSFEHNLKELCKCIPIHKIIP